MEMEYTNLVFLLKNMNNLQKIDKNWILDNFSRYTLNNNSWTDNQSLLYIIRNNYCCGLGFTKSDILNILKYFDLTQKYSNNWSILMYIIYNNKNQKLGFTKDDIFYIIENFNCNLDNFYYFMLPKNKFNDIPDFTKADEQKLMAKIGIEYI